MNSLLLAVLVSCQPVAAYPEAGPAHDGSSSHHGRHRLFGWLRGHHRDNKCPCGGNGHAGGGLPPGLAAPAPADQAGTVETVILEPAPTVVPPPATVGPAPRLVPRPQPVTTGAEPPLAAPLDDAPRRMPRGPMETTGAEPPRN
jgi:hypothetical protein